MRICRICGEDDQEAITRNVRMKGGLSTVCRACTAGQAKLGFNASAEEIIAYHAKYRAQPRRVRSEELAVRAEREKRRRADPANRLKLTRARRFRQYNLTDEQLAEMLAAQSGACPICKTPLSHQEWRGMQIDHDHSCCAHEGSCGLCVRGLLCSSCNLGLGCFQDDPQRLRNAIDYLAKGH